MKRLALLLPLLALAAAPAFALSLKPPPEEPYAAPTLPWREALAAADAAVGAATNGARCVILTWRQRDATWGAFYDAGDAYRSVTVDAAGRCVENAAKDPPWNSPAEFLPLAEAAAAAERASAGAVRTAALSRPDATWYVALSDDGTRKLVVVSPDGSVEPVPPPPEATDEERTANAGVVRVLPERAGDAWCVVAATNATALRGVRFAFLDAVNPTQTNLCFAVSGNGRWAAATFRHGCGNDAGALPDGAAEAVARALGPDAARLVADPANRVPCRFGVLDDVPSSHIETCRLPDDFAPSGENVRFLVCRSTEKDASGGYRTKDDVHAIVHFDSVSFGRSRPGDRIDRVRVMCHDPETGLPRGVAWDCVRQDDGTWLEGPAEDEILRLPAPAAPSPASEPHAENAESAETDPHAESVPRAEHGPDAEKWKRIVLPIVDYRQSSVVDVVAELEDLARNYDDFVAAARGQGVTFVLDVPADAVDSLPLVTCKMKSVSVYSAIDTIAEMSGLEWSVDGDVIRLTLAPGRPAANETHAEAEDGVDGGCFWAAPSAEN